MSIRPHVWIAAFSCLAVVSVAVVDVTRTSPGPLIAAHERQSELAGSFGCSSCHGGLTSSMRDACLACHATIADQLRTHQGLHGALDVDQAGQCALCHSDHHGAGFQSVNARSFVQAGFDPPPAPFDHARIGFDLGGAHTALACVECHEHADAPTLADGEVRYLGLLPNCASCHEDPHAGAMGRQCLDCHDQVDFSAPRSSDHDQWLALSGSHARASCRDCHAAGEPYALEAWGSAFSGPRHGAGARSAPTSRSPAPLAARTCADCHASPHADPFVSGVARLVELSPGASCVTCHASEHASFAGEAIDVTPRQHAASGFTLRVPHDGVGCAACHADASRPFGERFPGRQADDCAACHVDPHGAQFTASPEFAGGCLACHERHAFEPPAFGVEQHARTALPLEGAHARTSCHDCHTHLDPGGVRAFHGTSARCGSCHADAHGGYFERSAAGSEASADALPEGADDCATCHTTTAFAALSRPFDHTAWTRFPLAGAHVEARCESCHPRQASADEHGRRFGRVAELFGPIAEREHGATCALCHSDPHAGEFDRKGLPQRVGPRAEARSGCARCHTEVSFRALPWGFDHGRWTGFALDDAHAAADCAACHQALVFPEVSGRTWGRAAGTSCADCHADPHAGQFEDRRSEDPGRDACAGCHQSAASFAELAFDHGRSRFPLDDTHAALACSACHHPSPELHGNAIRYRPLGRQCADCHGTQEGPVRRRKRSR